MKKFLGILLATVMIISLVACGTPSETNDGVTLEWYYRGNGLQEDTAKVNARVNELLHKIPGFEHITIHLNPYTAKDYASSVLLAQSEGAQIDILSTVGLNWSSEVANGTFISLNDYLESSTYSTLANELPDWLWDSMSLDGEVYMVPNYQRGNTLPVLVFPKAYAEGIDVDALRADIADGWTATELNNIMKSIVDNARRITGKNTKYMLPVGWNPTSMTYPQYIEFLTSNSGVAIREGETELENWWASPDVKAIHAEAAQLMVDGYIHPEVSTNIDSLYRKNMLNDDAIVVYINNSYGTVEQMEAIHKNSSGFDHVCIPLFENYFMLSNWGAGGNGITSYCKNPDEAMAFLQLINTEAGAEIYNTIVYGLEGEHYTKNADGTIKTLEYDGSQGGSTTTYAALKWIMGNTRYAWLNQGCAPDDVEIMDAVNNDPNNLQSPLVGFSFNPEDVESELLKVTAVIKEYNDTIRFGLAGASFESVYNEFLSKLEAAGIGEILAEGQAQFNAR